MAEEILHHRGNTLVRRLTLEPGEAMPWHTDPYHRVSIVLRGEAIAIEFRDGSEGHQITLEPVQVDWDEPSDRVHRGVNVGGSVYEEITIFLLDRPDAPHQPAA